MEATHEGDVSSFASIILKNHLDNMLAEVNGVIEAKDIECIHRMRVASRRLRNALEIFQACYEKKEHSTWTEEIKYITRALGAARDIDVQMSLVQKIYNENLESRFLPGFRRILLRLSQKRAVLQKKIIQILRKIQKDMALDKMSASLLAYISEQPDQPYSSNLYQLSYERMNQRLENFLSFQKFIYFPDKKQELHAMRIAAKWLRYSLEVFSPLYSSGLKTPLKSTREAQELLGQIHDCDVWIEHLPEFIEKEKERTLKYCGNLRPFYRLHPGIEFVLENRLSERNVLYQDFLSQWEKWQEKDIWVELKHTICTPVIGVGQVFPPLGKPAVDAIEITENIEE